jgi:hypothetical protein
MRRYTQSFFLLAAILGVCLTTGCGGAVSATTSAPTPSPTTSSPSPTTSSPSSSAAATPTAPPSTQSAAVGPSSSPTSSSGSGTNLIWLWILLGALVLVGLIVLITRSAGRRSAAKAGWRSKIIDAYAKGAALYDAMSVAETPAGLAANDAGARWYDIQRRADDLAQTLYALGEAAPDEDSRARVGDTLASLQAVRSAMDAERAPGGAGPEYAAVVRDRMFAFQAALRALRSADEPLS